MALRFAVILLNKVRSLGLAQDQRFAYYGHEENSDEEIPPPPEAAPPLYHAVIPPPPMILPPPDTLPPAHLDEYGVTIPEPPLSPLSTTKL